MSPLSITVPNHSRLDKGSQALYWLRVFENTLHDRDSLFSCADELEQRMVEDSQSYVRTIFRLLKPTLSSAPSTSDRMPSTFSRFPDASAALIA
jgi:hypothetical protein